MNNPDIEPGTIHSSVGDLWIGVVNEFNIEYGSVVEVVIGDDSIMAEQELMKYLSKPTEDFQIEYNRENISDDTIRSAFDDALLYQGFTLELGAKLFMLALYLGIAESQTKCNSISDAMLSIYNAVNISDKMTSVDQEIDRKFITASVRKYDFYQRILVSSSICSLLIAPNISPSFYFMQMTFAPALLLGICAHSGVDDYVKHCKPEMLCSYLLKETMEEAYDHLISLMQMMLQHAV